MTFKISNHEPTDLPDTYQGLVAELVPTVIHDDIAYNNAVCMLSRLMDAEGTLNHEQSQYGELLGYLAAAYQREKSASPKPSGVKLLRGMMAHHDLKSADIARLLNVSPTLASRILKGQRNITWEHAKVLGERFGLTPEMFMKG